MDTCTRRWFDLTFIVFSVAFPGLSVPSDGPSIALSINVVSAHQPPAWHDRPGAIHVEIFSVNIYAKRSALLAAASSFFEMSEIW